MSSRRIERWVQGSVGLLIALSAIMLDVAQDQWTLSIIVVPATVFTHVFTDRLGLIRLPRLVVAMASLAAIFYFYSQYRVDSTTRQLSTIGNLLMAWSTLTLFQTKVERVFGSLAVFSLLAVVVAAVLNSGGFIYGLLLFAYALTACFAMMALFLLREETQIQNRAILGEDEFQRTRELIPSQLLREDPVIAYQTRSSESLADSVLGWGGVRQTTSLIVVTILFAIVYFYLIPRTERTRWKQSGVAVEQTVGFNDTISFDEMGKILESDRLAMRVAFFDEQTNQPYRVFGDIYMFGKPLIRYQEVDDSPFWSGYTRRGRSSRLPYVRGNEDREVVRLEVSLEPTQRSTRFGIFPFTRSRLTGRIDPLRWSNAKRNLFSINHPDRQEGYFSDRYTLATTALRRGAHSAFSPAFEEWPKAPTEGRLSLGHQADLLSVDRKKFPGLIAVADEIVSRLSGDTNVIRISRALQDHFLSSDVYTYTLDFSNIKRDEDLDPVEDFVVNHRSGHCEYFATALAMMLRSQDIPARVIVGFCGGEYNPVGKYLQFYERDAHAWVEVYLEPNEVPSNVFTEQFVGRTGAWYRLDPTPGVIEAAKTRRNQLDQWVDYAQFVWNDYVIDLDHETQQAAVYDPFAASESGQYGRRLLESGNHSFSANARAAVSAVMQSTTKLGAAGQSAVFIVLGILVVGLLASPLLLLRWLRRRTARTKRHSSKRQTIEFYVRLEKVLRRLGIKRAPSQTPLELAREAQKRLSQFPQGRGQSVSQIPSRIVGWFYDVRFGEQKLDVATLQQIEGDLALLEDVVAAK